MLGKQVGWSACVDRFLFFNLVVLGLSCGRWAPYLQLVGSLVAAGGLLSCSSRAPWLLLEGSLVASHRLLSCGSLAP